MQDQLTDKDYARLVKSLKKTHNRYVKFDLLKVMVRFGSTERRGKLVHIAIGDETPLYSLLSARALFVERDHVEKCQLDVITDEAIASVRPLVACWLVLLLASQATDNRLLALARSLAVNTDRRAILALLYVLAPDDHDDGSNEFIRDILPIPVRHALDQIHQSKDTSDLRVLDDLLNEVNSWGSSGANSKTPTSTSGDERPVVRWFVSVCKP